MTGDPQSSRVKLVLSDEQKQHLSEILGAELAEKIQHIDIEKVDGLLRSTLKVN